MTLWCVTLCGVTLWCVTLRGVTLRGVTLRGMTLRGVTLRGVTLRGVTLCGVNFRRVTLWCVTVCGVTLCGVTRWCVTLRGVTLRGVTLAGVISMTTPAATNIETHGDVASILVINNFTFIFWAWPCMGCHRDLLLLFFYWRSSAPCKLFYQSSTRRSEPFKSPDCNGRFTSTT